MQREERKEADTGPKEVPAGKRAGTGELADREGYAGGAQHHKLKEKMERNLFAGSFHCVKI